MQVGSHVESLLCAVLHDSTTTKLSMASATALATTYMHRLHLPGSQQISSCCHLCRGHCLQRDDATYISICYLPVARCSMQRMGFKRCCTFHMQGQHATLRCNCWLLRAGKARQRHAQNADARPPIIHAIDTCVTLDCILHSARRTSTPTPCARSSCCAWAP